MNQAEYRINRLIDSAQRKEQNGGFEMLWRSKTDPSLFAENELPSY
ncbi:hypothetical protein ABVN80_17355 [Acinetobacter baumannii]